MFTSRNPNLVVPFSTTPIRSPPLVIAVCSTMLFPVVVAFPAIYESPLTEKSLLGLVVPTPTFPLLNTVKSVVVALAVDDAIEKSVVLVSPLLAWTESFAYGEVVPMPTFPPSEI